MEKNYSAFEVEKKHYQRWEAKGAFASDVTSNREPYTIMMPPPNVTGSLHMGHALTFTLQDVLVRYQRMRGKDALWQPGTDHAGIATQMVVERQLAEKKQLRREMGREAFLKKVWEWKDESGGMITRQLRRLGASPDWKRERFTMDEGLSRAVSKVFVQLYHEKLIYKDNRLINWDPKLLTAISDLEVEQREVKGNMWHLRYPIEGTSEFIIVATTRPETMLGDSAVAVHPDHPTLKKFIGKNVILPLVGRRIPIVGDDYADPEKGTGAVKITPAHDFNDFEVGKRHKLPLINIFNKTAKVSLKDNVEFLAHKLTDKKEIEELALTVATYEGMERFTARKQIVERLESMGLLEKIEPHNYTVPHGDRSGVVIEPYLMEQWYCDAATLAKPAIEAVESGKTQFVPKQWENTYFEWMRNIQPWCISRQLWWGHQIPAWYGWEKAQVGGNPPYSKQVIFVAETEEEAIQQAEKHYGKKVKLTKDANEHLASQLDHPNIITIMRDEDVLDTWFSSALWPFSTLGWPDKTPELNRYYPTDVLVTGFDIIFFWVARMMMMGLHFMGDVPFKQIYIHALVRDEKGHKMSKTKGNVIDPLEVIEKYGTDALRFTLTNLSTPGRDIRLATSRIESGRNFATKLWNATRFCQMNGCELKPDFDPASVKQTVNRWIMGELSEAIKKTTEALDIYRFDEAANGLYQFAWNTFCDWYLEFSKPLLQGTDEAAKVETQATTAWVLNELMHLLQPVMPYITEEIWQSIAGASDNMLMQQAWPDAAKIPVDNAAMEEVRWVIAVISLIRSVRSELNIQPNASVPLIVRGANAKEQGLINSYADFLNKMARMGDTSFDAEIPNGSAQAVLGHVTFVLPLADVIDLGAERARLEKERVKLAEEIARLDQKLKNPNFSDKAPTEVVEEHKARLEEARTTLSSIDAAKARLSA